jgi:3-oxoacyl-[acyl-carrier-protein] synthase II
MRRVAITGLGAVTPLGTDAPATWAGLAAGRSGVGALTSFDASTFDVRIAGHVEGFTPPADVPGRHLSRAAAFAVAAAKEALRDAGETVTGGDPYAVGVALGGTVGRPELQELVDMSHRLAASDGADIPRQSPRDVLRRNQNVALSWVARVAGATGPLISVSTACAGSAHALGEAYRRIQEGDTTVMLAGGFDALTTWMDVLGFSLLGALTTAHNDDPGAACRPFDATRGGFVLGEGAVVAVLEDWDTAVARGADIKAELAGYGSTLNAYRITDSPPDGGGAITAMHGALDDAGLRPEDIDYVAAHGTGTPGNDASETTAVKAVFGPHAHRLSISSPKSMTGHLTSAAGGVNLVAAIGALREQVVPPTINLHHPDPALDLDYTPNEARPREVRAALVNAFAFGGTNACLVLRRAEPAAVAL